MATPRLRSLELQGYKTFAGKTEFVFAPTITAIVGPNGSGKSNIADSIRWVLGEQSYTLLRGKKTEDMIFAGSETRPRASMASASITFDNSDGWLPIDYTEVGIGRRAYRDAQNEYFLNGQRVRLRDVSELLSACGLAQRTYTVIGQGLVDEVLALKAEERRRLFEEAAGIGLYRSRREEALRRLESTQHNLERVQDILAELLPRLRSLERQARRAQEYEHVRDDLRAALRVWYGYHWARMQRRLAEAQEEAGRRSQERDEIRLGQESVYRELSETSATAAGLRDRLRFLTQQASARYAEREASGRRIAVAHERLRGLSDQETLTRSELTVWETTLAGLQERVVPLEREVLAATDAQAQALTAFDALHGLPLEGEADLGVLHSRLDEARERQDRLRAERADWSAQVAQLAERGRLLEEQLGESRRAWAGAGQSAEAAAASLRAGREVQAKAFAAREEATRAEATAHESRARSEEEGARAARRVNDLQAALASQQARATALRRSASEEEEPAGRLLQAAASGKLAGLVGRLSQQVQAPADVRRAILAALGEFRDGLAFRSIEDIGEALRMMNGDAWEGRAGLLPLTSPRPPHLLRAPQNAGCLGNAAELANVSERFRSAADLLLGRTLVVRDHEAARRLLASLPADGRVVTLAGELFYPGGQVLVSGGNPAQGASEALREAEAGAALLRDELSTAEAEAKRANAQTDSARNRAEGAAAAARQAEAAAQEAELRLKQAELTDRSAAAQEASQREAVQRLQGRVAEVAAERARLGERAASFDREQAELDAMIRALTARLTSLERPAAVAEAQSRLELARRAALEARGHLSDLQERLAAARGECESRRARLQTYLAGQDEARQAIQAAGQEQAHVEEAVVALEAEMGAGEESLAASEQKRAGLEAREARVRTELQEAEHRHSQAQIDLARRQQELDSLKQRIEDDFGLVDFEFEAGITGQGPLPIEGLVERLPHVDSLPLELESQVTRLRLQLRRMGAVNVEAQTEYTEVRERVDFLTSQVDDLRKAESQIQEVIAELDHLMEREFRKTFEAVATTFRQTFSRLFGGGSARLVLTDADDLTNTGIDIEARLPGRREHGLAMLSGGERSLTACALVFSLLKVSPTPFCVLDEVDAMLDEANVARFGEMLRELANDTQFIMITHNRQTIQTAEVVYGISMGPDSASRMISLKLDQVEKEVLGKG